MRSCLCPDKIRLSVRAIGVVAIFHRIVANFATVAAVVAAILTEPHVGIHTTKHAEARTLALVLCLAADGARVSHSGCLVKYSAGR
jgi:hypothetical protein